MTQHPFERPKPSSSEQTLHLVQHASVHINSLQIFLIFFKLGCISFGGPAAHLVFFHQKFVQQLKAHQRGETDYYTFCKDCAENGVEKWVVCLEKMTCIYYDTAGNEVLVEKIPQ